MGIPVKVFKSSDTDAPQLSGGRGDLKTLLKACLVTGWGSGENRKEPLGWEIVAGTESADGYDCAFRPTDITSAQNIINVAGINGWSTNVSAYFDVGIDGALVDPSPTLPAIPTWAAPGVDWVIVGHSRSFIVVIRARTALGGSQAGANCSTFFFGELTDRINNARGNSILVRFYSGYDAFNYAYGGMAEFWAGQYSHISQSVDGKKKWVSIVPAALFKNLITGYSPIDSEIVYSKMAFTQEGALRGFAPFGYVVHHRLPASDNFTYKSIGNVQHLLFNCSPGSTESLTWGDNTLFTLLNLEEWEN